MANEVTDQNFEEILKKEKNVLIKLSAPWCAPCKTQNSIISEIIEKDALRKDVAIYEMNIDENPVTPTKLGCRGIPFMVLFSNGDVKGTQVGLIQEKPLLEWIDETIGN
tara:strand:- start:420 stop:746 length:327 start_codon:yes stop_codon:yes gene_type:complete